MSFHRFKTCSDMFQQRFKYFRLHCQGGIQWVRRWSIGPQPEASAKKHGPNMAKTWTKYCQDFWILHDNFLVTFQKYSVNNLTISDRWRQRHDKKCQNMALIQPKNGLNIVLVIQYCRVLFCWLSQQKLPKYGPYLVQTWPKYNSDHWILQGISEMVLQGSLVKIRTILDM